jgi:hypothetical protein
MTEPAYLVGVLPCCTVPGNRERAYAAITLLTVTPVLGWAESQP